MVNFQELTAVLNLPGSYLPSVPGYWKAERGRVDNYHINYDFTTSLIEAGRLRLQLFDFPLESVVILVIITVYLSDVSHHTSLI